MTRPQFAPKARLTRGFHGSEGGRWGRMPQPPSWIGTSVQVCGIYPYVAGAGAPTNGAPVGVHLRSGAWVGLDPDSLYKAGVITSPTMMLFGLNGFGKSSTAQTMAACMIARGVVPVINDPIKGEHVDFTRQMGGQVRSMGPGLDRLNILGAGPLDDAAARIGGEVGDQLRKLALSKCVDLTRMMFNLTRGSVVEDYEKTCLEYLVRHVRARNQRPVTGDLVRCFTEAPDDVLSALGITDRAEFHKEYHRVGKTLRSMMAGELGQLLGGDETVPLEAGNPGGFCFDLSAIGESNRAQLSAAMLGTWSLSMDAIDAHWELAKAEQAKADEAALAGDRYKPEVVWGGFLSLQDEFWYPIRHVPGLVDIADRLARTNRSVGVVEIKITHSPNDFLSLPNEKDRETAMGLASKSGLIGTLALAQKDREQLANVKSLNRTELDEIAGFGGATSWAGTQMVGTNGKPVPPPGAGKVMFKVDGLPGVPVKMVQPPSQDRHHITDARVRAAVLAERKHTV